MPFISGGGGGGAGGITVKREILATDTASVPGTNADTPLHWTYDGASDVLLDLTNPLAPAVNSTGLFLLFLVLQAAPAVAGRIFVSLTVDANGDNQSVFGQLPLDATRDVTMNVSVGSHLTSGMVITAVANNNAGGGNDVNVSLSGFVLRIT